MLKIDFLLSILLFTVVGLNAQNYKNADLPDAMTFLDGSRVKTKADWEKRKTEIKNLWCKLGLYNKKESKIPYDYNDVIQMIAPRKVLVYAPLRDRFTDADDVSNCVEKAQTAWTNKENFQFKAPDDICRFQKDQQDVVLDWLNKFGE